jgi:hypothetical protein
MPDILQWLSVTVMSKDTCAVLTAVFPIALLTVVLERRSIHLNIRRQGWFRWATQTIVSACAIGLVLTIIGVQTNGLSTLGGAVAWVACGVAVIGLPLTLLAALATAEAEEDREPAAQSD